MCIKRNGKGKERKKKIGKECSVCEVQVIRRGKEKNGKEGKGKKGKERAGMYMVKNCKRIEKEKIKKGTKWNV